MTFEEKLAKIDEISKSMADPETDLSKAVDLYEEGMKLVKEADEELSSIERKIEIVTSKAGSGSIVSEPYSPSL